MAPEAGMIKEDKDWGGSNVSKLKKKKRVICVMDASGPVGSTLVQRLLQRGYIVHAALLHTYSNTPHSDHDNNFHGEARCLEGLSSCDDKKLRIFHSDPLDYHSIIDALKGCSGLFYCFEPPPDHPTYDELMAEVEVRAAHNVLEACAQTHTIEKVVFTSSVTAVIWNQVAAASGCNNNNNNSNTVSDIVIDERNWTDINFCKKFKLWHGLSKTLAEKTAWSLAMDRGLNMVSVNGGLLMGPPDHHLVTINNPYLKGAAEMYEDGVFVTVDLRFLVDAHICVFEDVSSYGRYLCFNRVVNSSVTALELTHMLFPTAPPHQTRQSLEDTKVYQQRISNKKLNKLMVDFESGPEKLNTSK